MSNNQFAFQHYTARFWVPKSTPSTRLVEEKLASLSSPTIEQLLENLWVPMKKGPPSVRLVFSYYGMPVLTVMVKSHGPYRDNQCAYEIQYYEEDTILEKDTTSYRDLSSVISGWLEKGERSFRRYYDTQNAAYVRNRPSLLDREL